jgi:hypothetical protein
MILKVGVLFRHRNLQGIGHLHINTYFGLGLINIVLREFYEFCSGCRSCELATSCKSPPRLFHPSLLCGCKRLFASGFARSFFSIPGIGHELLTIIVRYAPILVSTLGPALVVFISRTEMKTCLRLSIPRRKQSSLLA